MYKAAVRTLIRRSVASLNDGDLSPLLRMAHPRFELCFPGDNSWSRMFRPPRPSREPHVTHSGVDEARAFAERFVAERVQIRIEDILVNGAPWKMRVAIRSQVFIASELGDSDIYANRAVLLLEIRWGRLVRWEDYEDTQRIAAWDAMRLTDSGPGDAAPGVG